AETTDGHSIIVKYLQENNVEAHNFCAQKRLAPQILHVSNPEELKVPGGYTDFVPGTFLSKKDRIDPRHL
ncbi:24389_t:CDS:1, partial [Gigaspora rosea]